MSKTKTVYAEKDYVQVARKGAEEPLADPVPKSWLGTDLLEPDVVEFKGSSSSGSSTAAEAVPEGEPSEEWTGKQLDAYAKEHDIALGSAGTKAEKVAAIVKAEADRAAAAGSGNDGQNDGATTVTGD